MGLGFKVQGLGFRVLVSTFCPGACSSRHDAGGGGGSIGMRRAGGAAAVVLTHGLGFRVLGSNIRGSCTCYLLSRYRYKKSDLGCVKLHGSVKKAVLHLVFLFSQLSTLIVVGSATSRTTPSSMRIFEACYRHQFINLRASTLPQKSGAPS